MNPVLAGVLAYVLVQLAIGVWIASFSAGAAVGPLVGGAFAGIGILDHHRGFPVMAVRYQRRIRFQFVNDFLFLENSLDA